MNSHLNHTEQQGRFLAVVCYSSVAVYTSCRGTYLSIPYCIRCKVGGLVSMSTIHSIRMQ